jgi:hypothetical protein
MKNERCAAHERGREEEGVSRRGKYKSDVLSGEREGERERSRERFKNGLSVRRVPTLDLGVGFDTGAAQAARRGRGEAEERQRRGRGEAAARA